jgi:hypothetical protein
LSESGGNQLLVIIAGVFAMVFLPVVIVIALILGSIGALNSPPPCSTGQPNQSGTFSYPTDKRETEKGFDQDNPEHPRHAGVDFNVAAGTEVRAAADGAVLTTSNNIVKIQHPGDIQTWYQYFDEIFVHDGDRVTRGQKIGKSGSGDESPHGMTGEHLHFEIRIKDDETQQYMAVDPTGLLGDAPAPSNGTPGGPGQGGGGTAPSLMGQATVTAAQLAAWYRSGNRPDPDAQINGAGPSLEDLTRWYVDHGNAENVRGDMAFVQAVHETGNFGNADSDIFNFAGIGHCDSCPSGSPFGSAEDGVIGHLQLLKRVANGNNIGFALPASPNLPRWGGRRISTWDQMGGGNGAWASDPNYWNALSRLASSLWQHAGVQPPGGGAGGCGGGGGTVVETALNLAWDTPGHGPYESDAKPTYQQAMPQYNGSVGTDPFSDCGVFVATVMHMTGADPQYPKRGTGEQQTYVQSHPEKYDVFPNLTNTSQLQPGDIFIVNNGRSGHTYIYTGDYQGGNNQRYNAASASLHGHVPQATNTYFADSRGHYIVARLKVRT